VLKIWDGSAWRSEAGEFVDAAGDTMTGALILPSGTAAAPALGVGSTDNGIYSPGADQVAISTNGTQRLLINANGTLSNSAATALAASFTGIGSAYVDTTNGTGTFRVQLLSNTPTIGAATNHSLVFTTNNTERMRLTSDGKLGLGTSAPSGNLDVRGLSGTTIIRAVGVDSNGNADAEIFSTGTTGSSRLFFSDTAAQSGSIIYSHNNNSFAFATNGGGADVVIDSSGRLGLGTSSPQDLLHVEGGSSPTIRLRNSTTGSNASPASTYIDFRGFNQEIRARIEAQDRRASVLGGFLNIATANTSNALTNAIHIDSSQRVGIGTTSPAAPLDIEGSSAGIVFKGKVANGLTFARYDFNGDLTTNGCYILSYGSTYASASLLNVGPDGTILNNLTGDLGVNVSSGKTIRFGVNNAERARIDSSGRLLVGTSSARSVSSNIVGAGTNIPLHQVESLLPNCASFTTNSASVYGPTLHFVKSRGSAIGSNNLVNNGDYLGAIAFAGKDGSSVPVNAASIVAQVDGIPGANDMPGRLTFSTTADGASSPTERMRIDSAGAVKIGGTNIELNANGSADFAGTVNIAGTAYLGTANGVQLHSAGYIATSRTSGTTFLTYQTGNSTATINFQANGNATFAGTVTANKSSFYRERTTNGPNANPIEEAIIEYGSSGNVYAGLYAHNEYQSNLGTALSFKVTNRSTNTTSTAVYIDQPGNLLIGGTLPDNPNISLNADGSATFAGDLLPDTDNTGNVGTSSLTWNDGQFTDLSVNGTLTSHDIDNTGRYVSSITAVSALAIDCASGNYFTKTINANSTFTFTNVPASRAFSFTLELTHTSGTVTWPSSVEFPGDTAPTLTTGKTHLFMFVTDDGGARFRGAALVDYDN
jgi:hypothetical protein